jgi:hypothetical protein
MWSRAWKKLGKYYETSIAMHTHLNIPREDILGTKKGICKMHACSVKIMVIHAAGG